MNKNNEIWNQIPEPKRYFYCINWTNTGLNKKATKIFIYYDTNLKDFFPYYLLQEKKEREEKEEKIKRMINKKNNMKLIGMIKLN